MPNDPVPHPFTLRHNQLCLPVHIGDEGVEGEFLLDTGCSQTVVSTSFLGRMRLPIAGVRGSTAMAAGGPIGHSVEGITLPSLTAAGQRVEQLQITQVNTLPLKQQFGSAPDGVLGANFLRHFESTIDYPAKAIALRRTDENADPESGSPLAAESDHVLNCHLRDGWLFECEGRINEAARVTVLIDAGTPRSILNWNAARAIGYAPESPQLKPGQSPIHGMDGRSIHALYAPPMPVSVGPVTWPASVLAIADMQIIRALHIGFMPILILGNDLLASVVLVLNYQLARIGLFPSGYNPDGP